MPIPARPFVSQTFVEPNALQAGSADDFWDTVKQRHRPSRFLYIGGAGQPFRPGRYPKAIGDARRFLIKNQRLRTCSSQAVL
jgi:hypothetical protein